MNAEKNKVYLFFAIIFLAIILRLAIPDYLSGYSVNVRTSVVIDPGIRVIYTEFNGDTSDMLNMNDTGLGQISNMVLEVQDYGKITFNETINLTINKDANNQINLDAHIEMSEGSIAIDIANLTSLNASARIYMYNLTYITPQIVKNGIDCSVTECAQISYSDGILIFDVTLFGANGTFTSYTLRERYTAPVTEQPSGQPSGSTQRDIRDSGLSLNSNTILVNLKQAQLTIKELTLKNDGDETIIISLTLPKLEKYITIDNSLFALAPRQSKIITLTFNASISLEANLYESYLLIKANDATTYVKILMNVIEKQLFEITLKAPDEIEFNGKDYLELYIINLGKKRPIDAEAKCYIVDADNEYLLFQEKISLNHILTFNNSFHVPDSIMPGKFVLMCIVETSDTKDIVTRDFYITSRGLIPPILQAPYSLYNLLAILILLLIVFSIYAYSRRKKTKLGKPLNKSKTIISRYKRGKL